MAAQPSGATVFRPSAEIATTRALKSRVSYLGQFGGRHVLAFWWDLGVVAAFSLGVYAAALATRRAGAAVRAELDALRAEGPELS